MSEDDSFEDGVYIKVNKENLERMIDKFWISKSLLEFIIDKFDFKDPVISGLPGYCVYKDEEAGKLYFFEKKDNEYRLSHTQEI